jgi:hypothetical protein
MAWFILNSVLPARRRPRHQRRHKRASAGESDPRCPQLVLPQAAHEELGWGGVHYEPVTVEQANVQRRRRHSNVLLMRVSAVFGSLRGAICVRRQRS